MAVYVIAEAACTHDLDLRKAKDLCLIAANAGANAVKFQYCSDIELMAKRRNLPTVPEGYRLLNFEKVWLSQLAEYAHNMHIEFLCTVFIPQDIEVIAPYVDRFKVASLESQDLAFLQAHPEDREVLVSLGVGGLMHNGYRRTFLHCVSGYPTPKREANLAIITASPELGQDYFGFSDHTMSFVSGAVAVARGATIIEKHIRHTLTEQSNPDYRHSFTQSMFARYVELIREAETLLGDGIRQVMPSEAGLVPHVVRP